VKVLALILALIGVGGVSAVAAPPAPSNVPTQTVAAAPVVARDAFSRPPRMVHTVVVVKPAAKPVKAAKPAVKKKPTATVKKKHKTTTTTARVRANLDRGILPSAYTGPYYDARYEAKRRCIVKRESEGRYGARNKSSGAAGAYQFMPAWTRTIQRILDLLAGARGTLRQVQYEGSHTARLDPEPAYGSPWQTPDLPADLLADLASVMDALDALHRKAHLRADLPAPIVEV